MKITLTALITAIFIGARWIYGASYAIAAARLSAQQMDDTNASFLFANLLSQAHIMGVLWAAYVCLIILIWIPTIKKFIKNKPTTAA